MKWIELAVEVHPEAVDAVAEVFHQHGTNGVAIEQAVTADPEGEHEPLPAGLPVIKAYLPALPASEHQERRIEEALWHLQAFQLAPVGPVVRREVDEEDWADAWKQHFHPLRVGRVIVKPTWRSWAAAADEVVVELDPGMAFGTGLHPTTRLVLRALQERAGPRKQVLDLGTGSGILAIAAAKLGATVTAVDISEVAVRVAAGNIEVNGLSGRIQVMQGSIEVVGGQGFDLVLANIIASVLIDLAPQLGAALAPHGEVLASGIIDDRVDAVRNAFSAADLTVTDETREGDWWLLAAGRAP